MTTPSQRSPLLGIPIDTSYFETAMQGAINESSFPRQFTNWLPDTYNTLLEFIRELGVKMPGTYWLQTGTHLHNRVNDAKLQNRPIDELDPKLVEMIGSLFLHGPGRGLQRPEMALSEQTKAAQGLFSAILAEKPPPLLVWNTDRKTPRLWTIENTPFPEIAAPILYLSANLANRGVFAWAYYAYDFAGQHSLTAAPGLLKEMREVTRVAFSKHFDIYNDALEHSFYSSLFISHFLSEIDKITSDILALLHLGPTAAFSLISILRLFGTQKLKPDDLLRALIAKATIAKLSIKAKQAWTNAIDTEAKKELSHHSSITIEHTPVPLPIVEKTLQHLTEQLFSTKLSSLNNKALSELHSWNESDEQHTQMICSILRGDLEILLSGETPFKAEHILAAAITESMRNSANLPQIFNEMVSSLKELDRINSNHRLKNE